MKRSTVNRLKKVVMTATTLAALAAPAAVFARGPEEFARGRAPNAQFRGPAVSGRADAGRRDFDRDRGHFGVGINAAPTYAAPYAYGPAYCDPSGFYDQFGAFHAYAGCAVPPVY